MINQGRQGISNAAGGASLVGQRLAQAANLQPRLAVAGGVPDVPLRVGVSESVPNRSGLVRSDMAAHRVGDEIHLDGQGVKGTTNSEIRADLAKEIKKYKGAQLNVGENNTYKAKMNKDSRQKYVSESKNLSKRAEMVNDIPDLIKMSQPAPVDSKISIESDTKGLHKWSQDGWDRRVTKNVRLNDGLNDVYSKIGKSGDKSNFYTFSEIEKSLTGTRSQHAGVGTERQAQSVTNSVPKNTTDVNTRTNTKWARQYPEGKSKNSTVTAKPQTESTGSLRALPRQQDSATNKSVADNGANVNTRTGKQSQSVIYKKNINNSEAANKALGELSREYDPIINKTIEDSAVNWRENSLDIL